jgi:hypothetical protein
VNARVLCLAAVACALACGPAAKRAEGNQPPLVVVDAPREVAVGESAAISMAKSEDLDGNILESQILFGDGSDPVVGYDDTEHVYAQAGVYTIDVYAKDDKGATARARARIVVTE